MKICIFCPTTLTPTTKPEHVLLDAFGGRMKTREADCSGCNELFGGTIDGPFAAQFIQLRNLLQLKSGSGDPPPRLPKVQAGGLTLSIEGDATMQLVGKPFTVEEGSDGSWSVQMRARSAEHFQKHVPNIAAQIGISVEELNSQMRAAATVTEHRVWPAPVGMPLQMGTPEALRSMVKSALVLWSVLVSNGEVRSEPFAAARRFVTQGDGTFERSRTHLDARRLPFEAEASAAYGPLFNLIYVRSDKRGRVIGHFTLYNLLGWRFVLAEQGGSAGRAVALISNPESPGTWSSDGAAQFDLPIAWLDYPIDDPGTARERMTDLYRRYQRTATVLQMRRIIDEAALALGYKQDQPLPPDQLHALSQPPSAASAICSCGCPRNSS